MVQSKILTQCRHRTFWKPCGKKKKILLTWRTVCLIEWSTNNRSIRWLTDNWSTGWIDRWIEVLTHCLEFWASLNITPVIPKQKLTDLSGSSVFWSAVFKEYAHEKDRSSEKKASCPGTSVLGTSSKEYYRKMKVCLLWVLWQICNKIWREEKKTR